MIGLGALGYDARPQFNRATAKRCGKVGMDLLVCTPEKLAECMATITRGRGYGSSTSLPTVSPDSSARCASATRSSG